MSSNVDSRGVPRGSCSSAGCMCKDYQKGAAGLKCVDCGHPPGKHENLAELGSSNTRSHSSSAGVHSTSYARTTAGLGTTHTHQSHQFGGYGIGGHITPSHRQLTRKKCKVCTNFNHVDPRVGEFDYCSPQCRDQDLLPRERERLANDLQAFEVSVLQDTSRGSRNGSLPESTQGASLFYGSGSKPTITSSSGMVTGRSTHGGACNDGASGKQKTFQHTFKKSPHKDIGLIIHEEKYRCETFSGLLVLGFGYNTIAEPMIMRGDVHLLDVITKLNDKEASLLTYSEEVKKSTGSLVFDRSIALPTLDELVTKAKSSHPTHIVAVMNPKDIPHCSTEKGFGLEVTTPPESTYVSAVTENTPARSSQLKYGDEIVTFGFVKNGKLKLGKGRLDNHALKERSSEGNTLVLVIKRS